MQQEKHCDWLILGHVLLIKLKCILKGMQLLLLVLILAACDQSMTNSAIIFSSRPKNTASFGLKTMKTQGSSVMAP